MSKAELLDLWVHVEWVYFMLSILWLSYKEGRNEDQCKNFKNDDRSNSR